MAHSIITATIGGETITLNESDEHLLRFGSWHMDKGYARRTVTGEQGPEKDYFHRLVVGASKSMRVDHIDGDTRNNTRANLRICTHAKNMINRKIHKSNRCGLKGVYADRNRWRAQITIDGNQKHLGSYSTKEEAHAAYLAASKELHGEYARRL